MNSLIKTIRGRITFQTALFLILTIVICEVVSVTSLRNNMTSQAEEFVKGQAISNADVVDERVHAELLEMRVGDRAARFPFFERAFADRSFLRFQRPLEEDGPI